MSHKAHNSNQEYTNVPPDCCKSGAKNRCAKGFCKSAAAQIRGHRIAMGAVNIVHIMKINLESGILYPRNIKKLCKVLGIQDSEIFFGRILNPGFKIQDSEKIFLNPKP